jgi:transcriptional regulator GlxA family with amidase domain
MPQSTPAALYGLYEVFASVGVAWCELTGEPPAGPRMEVAIVSATGEPYLCPLGTPIAPQASLGTVTRTDLIVIADLALPAGCDPRGRWPDETAWIRAQFAAGATVASVCTGAILLADTGLLDGGEATSHWSVVPLFREHYARVRLRPERILVRNGADQRLVTGGGAAAWEDLALYLIARFSAPAEAVRIAKLFQFGDRSEGQLLYAARLPARRHDDAVIARCQGWIAEHYALDNPVARLVAESGLAERTFARRFQAATGYAPVEYVQTLRIEEAKQLLESTTEPVDLVAQRVGYADPTFFRKLFKRRTGVTPARYRQRFQGIGQPSDG